MTRIIHVLCLAVLLVVGGCAKSPVTRENFARIETGMSKAQVEAIFGAPGQSYQQGIVTWKASETKLITVVFDDRGMVSEKYMEGL